MKRLCRNLALLSVVVLAAQLACTSNPFGDEEIKRPNYKTISGHLDLNDNATPDDIYVWLGGTALGTRTDRNGDFQLTLPPSGNAGSVNSSGIFNLYFYVANYKLSSATVVTHNDEFLFGQGDLDARGHVFGTRHLAKLLHIRTQAFPGSVRADYAGPIDILMTLQATLDSVTVVLPKVVGGLLGGIVLKKKDTGQAFYSIPDIDAKTRLIARIGTDPRSWRMVLNLHRGQFPPGRYEIIPYMFVQQEEVSAALLQSLGPNVEEISEDFLKIPYKRENGELAIGM
jgi:hypothetical protein